MGPDNEDDLCAFLKEKLRSWETSLNSFEPLADTGDYPGKEEIAEALGVLRPLLASDESYKFIDRFNQCKNDLLDLGDNFHSLEQFYENQRPTWEKLRSAYQKFQLNQESIAHLNQAEQETVRALDRALEKVEAFVRMPPVKEETAEEPPVEKAKVTVKPRCIVKPAELVGMGYLETTDDIDKFLGELRERLEKAIKAGQRIKIR